MTCTICGMSGTVLCAHHIAAYGDKWAEGNRVFCDFVHRRKVAPARPQDHFDYIMEYWGADFA